MRETLEAKDGFIYTNGTNYGSTIYLEDGVSSEGYYLITVEEYEKIFPKQEINI
jgi:hypothetical protein